jgi:plastocyanin domain-containing protein
MNKTILFWATLAGFGFLLGAVSGVIAAETKPQAAKQFQPMIQPIENRIVVTLGGLGLMGAELWWFLLNSKKP